MLKDLIKLIIDPEFGDVTDPVDGLDVIITKSGTGFNTEYDVKTLRRNSPVGFNEWEESLLDLKPLQKCKTYQEIQAIMDGKKDESDDGDENTHAASEAATAPKSNPEPTPPTAPATSDDSLEDEIQAAIARRKNNK